MGEKVLENIVKVKFDTDKYLCVTQLIISQKMYWILVNLIQDTQFYAKKQ